MSEHQRLESKRCALSGINSQCRCAGVTSKKCWALVKWAVEHFSAYTARTERQVWGPVAIQPIVRSRSASSVCRCCVRRGWDAAKCVVIHRWNRSKYLSPSATATTTPKKIYQTTIRVQWTQEKARAEIPDSADTRWHDLSPVRALPDRKHNITMHREPGLADIIRADSRFQDCRIFGDCAYGRDDVVLSPFRGAVRNLTACQKEINRSMSKLRVSVEWSYGLIGNYWTALDFKRQQRAGMQPIGQMYKAGVLFTNCLTCLRGRNTVSDFFQVPPPTINQFLKR